MFGKIRTSWYCMRFWCSAKFEKVAFYLSKGGYIGDCFLLLDLLLLVAGIRNVSTSKWANERKVRIITNCLYAFYCCLYFLQLFDALQTKLDDVTLVIFAMIKVLILCMAGVRTWSIVLLKKPITSLRNFITSNRVNSGDEAFDELEQRKFNKFGQATLVVIYSMTIFDTIVLSTPNSLKDSLLQLPPQLDSTEMLTSAVVYFTCFGLLAPIAVPRMFSNLACNGILLVGMRSKLRMLVHRYETIVSQEFSNIENYYGHIERKVQEAVNQQLEFWRHLQVLKDFAAKQMFVVHYFCICTIGSLLYVASDLGLNVMSIAVSVAALLMLLEHFLWCHLVDSLEDEADSIGNLIFELSAQIPYSREHRSRYKKIQSSLMITWIATTNGFSMNCMGLFKISTISFVNLVHIAYSVLMFLINMH